MYLALNELIHSIRTWWYSVYETEEQKYRHETDENFHKRWDWVLNEMIWAHEQIADDNWEDQYYSGEVDWVAEPGGHLRKGPNHTYKLDIEGFNKHNDRIENGLRLFGKYYRTLWD